MTASFLQQLLALYFAIIYSWQLSSSEDFFYWDFFFSFSLTNTCSPCRIRKAYVVLWAANRFIGSDTAKHVFDQFWKFKFHVEYFPRSTQFLSFDEPRNCLYLFKNHRQTYSWPGERPSSQLKVTIMWFGLNIKYLFGTLPCGFLLPERHLLFIFGFHLNIENPNKPCLSK